MLTAISVITIVICVFLVIFVLVQNPKGGGLAQNFASTQQILGVRKTTDFLTTATWFCAIAIMCLSFISVATLPTHNSESTKSLVEDIIGNQAPATASPAFATPDAETAPAMETPAATETPAE